MKEFIETVKENKFFFIGLFALFLIVLISDCIAYYYLKYEVNNEETTINDYVAVAEEEITKVIVEIKGEVVNPGVYEVNSSKRVNDVIKLAGGLTPNASTEINNLSKRVTDEMVIIIYSIDEITNFIVVKEKEQILIDECNKSNNSCISNNEVGEKSTTLISINEASKEELMKLPGIGESKALAIINYREEKKFETTDEIKKVPGIGESIYDQIKDLITT